jgi:hypothetical protein
MLITTSLELTDPTASATWIFANLSYTGMRAQSTGSRFWRIVSFIFGFPGTLLTYWLVEEGSERAYGIDMPRRRMRHKLPFTYQTGDNVREGDKIVFQGEPGQVEFVASASSGTPEQKRYAEQHPKGILITTAKGSSIFLTNDHDVKDLVFISREEESAPNSES